MEYPRETAIERFRRTVRPEAQPCAQCEELTTKPQATPFGLICPVCVARNAEMARGEEKYPRNPTEIWTHDHQRSSRKTTRPQRTPDV